MALAAHGAHGFVGGVVGLFEEQPLDLTRDQGQQRFALQPGGRPQAGQGAHRGHQVEQRNHGVESAAGGKVGGSAGGQKDGVADV